MIWFAKRVKYIHFSTCKGCNARVNFNRIYWEETLKEKINDSYPAYSKIRKTP